MIKKFFSIIIIVVVFVGVSRFTVSCLGNDLDKVKKEISDDIIPELDKIKNELFNEIYTRYPYVAREDEIARYQEAVAKIIEKLSDIETSYEVDENMNTLIGYCTDLTSTLVAVCLSVSSFGECVNNGETSTLLYNSVVEDVREHEKEYDGLSGHLKDILTTESDM